MKRDDMISFSHRDSFLTLRFFPLAAFLLLRRFSGVFVMDRNVLQAKPLAVRRESRIPGIGIPFRFHEDAVFTGFAFDKYAVPAQAAGIKPHLVVIFKKENLVIHEAGFLELLILLIGKDDDLFYSELSLALWCRMSWILTVDIG